MQIFFLSGLGADRSVFRLLDFSWCNPVFIDWIQPRKKESLQHYALRIKDAYIPDDGYIVGLSFGGMLATEIAKRYPQINAVLISSAKTKFEIPAIYRYGKYFPLHQWSSEHMQRWFMLRAQWLFGITTAQAQEIYQAVIKKSDTIFNQWAIDAIINWDNIEIPGNIVHLHGTHDKILPYKYVQCDYTIEKGGHLMVMEQADIISALLQEITISIP